MIQHQTCTWCLLPYDNCLNSLNDKKKIKKLKKNIDYNKFLPLAGAYVLVPWPPQKFGTNPHLLPMESWLSSYHTNLGNNNIPFL